MVLGTQIALLTFGPNALEQESLSTKSLVGIISERGCIGGGVGPPLKGLATSYSKTNVPDNLEVQNASQEITES